MANVVQQAQEFLARIGLDGWLLHDYRFSNPIFWQVVGHASHVTRPCFLWVPRRGQPLLLVHHVDAGRFAPLGWPAVSYRSRDELVARLREWLGEAKRVAMEYSPLNALPRVSLVDAGTVELVRSLGPEVISSADLLQYATQRWTAPQLASHRGAADKLGRIVQEGFTYIGQHLTTGVTEHQVAAFIRGRFDEEHLWTDEGPIVAANAHASDPHFQPTPEGSSTFRRGDWVLIDLWARDPSPEGVFADITWVAYIGQEAPRRYQEVFQVVTGARDAAVEHLGHAFQEGRTLQGWEMDRVARGYITRAGYGDFFTHRLGHSLGREVHADAVNLDSHETHDTRPIIPGIGFTIEPGIYLPDFGVRSEIDLFMSERGPEVTTVVQEEIVLIGAA